VPLILSMIVISSTIFDIHVKTGGEEDRTLDPLAGTPVFQDRCINRSPPLRAETCSSRMAPACALARMTLRAPMYLRSAGGIRRCIAC